MASNHSVRYNENKAGYVTLLSVLVLGAISSAVTITLLVLGIQSSQTSSSGLHSLQAHALAEACTEEALQEIRDSTLYTGSGSLSNAAGSCQYDVSSEGVERRRIQASSTVQTVTKKVEVTLDQINPEINVTSWKTVRNF
jgi:hypothetical protein